MPQCPYARMTGDRVTDDLVIRPERPDDEEAIREVVAAAFGSDLEAQLVDDIRASPHYIPELALVAERGGRVVGHVMIGYAWLDDGESRRRIVTLSPLAVLPEAQRSGVGSALVRAVTSAADEIGEPLVVLEGSPTYYGRLGFEPASRSGIEMTLPSWAPPEAAQVMKLRAYDPALRGRVVYPSAFEAAAEHDG
jgi:putative acetyltransferase